VKKTEIYIQEAQTATNKTTQEDPQADTVIKMAKSSDKVKNLMQQKKRRQLHTRKTP